VCYDADYTPFGQELAYVNNCPQNYKFTGMERDTETGNDHTWFRGYEWNLGRWMSPDPLGGSIGNPQSLNRYTYVLNDPCSLADPLGLKPSCSYTVRLTSQVKDLGFIGTVEAEIQRIFGLAGLGVDFTSASSADFSLGVVNGVSPNGPRIAGETPSEYYGAPPGHYGYVYAGTMTSLVPLTGVSYGFLGTALGRAGAHEMGHYFLGQLDHLVAQGLMQAGFAGNTWFLPDPNGTLFGFTPDQAAQLRNDCAQRHPSSNGGGAAEGGLAGHHTYTRQRTLTAGAAVGGHGNRPGVRPRQS
jgi:RHS repeat-associated protein